MLRDTTIRAAVVVLGLLAGPLGCASESNCDMSSCDATAERQSTDAITRGIAGIVAYQTDDCFEGCCECSMGSAHLDVWKAGAQVASAAEASAILANDAPAFGLDLRGSYAMELASGSYLLCDSQGLEVSCAALTIGAVGVFTVNVRATFGGAGLVVFPPRGSPGVGNVFVVDPPDAN